MGRIGLPEVLVILVVLLLFFGARKLPELGRALGSGIKEFKKATREVTAEAADEADDGPAHSDAKGQQSPTRS